MISDSYLYVNEFGANFFTYLSVLLRTHHIHMCIYDIYSLFMEESYKEELIRQFTWGFFVFMSISIVVLLETLILNKGCTL